MTVEKTHISYGGFVRPAMLGIMGSSDWCAGPAKKLPLLPSPKSSVMLQHKSPLAHLKARRYAIEVTLPGPLHQHLATS